MNRRLFIFCFVVFLVVVIASVFLLSRGEKPCYEVVDLTMAGGVIYSVSAINDVGQIAGCFEKGSGGEGTGIWDNDGGFIEFSKVDGESCMILDINNKGQAVGHILDKESRLPLGFFRDADGTIRLLRFEEGASTSARAINDMGDVVGIISKGEGGQKEDIKKRVFMWNKNDGMRVVDGIEGSFLSIGGINEAGQVAGIVGNANGSQAFVWSEKSGIVYIGVEASRIFDIDESGNVLGTVRNNEGMLFIWNESDGVRMLDVGGDMVVKCKMNERGAIVGIVIDFGIDLFGKYRIRNDRITPFMYTGDGKKVMLDRLFDKDVAFWPVDINNNGWIVCEVFDGSSSSGSRGVLLRCE